MKIASDTPNERSIRHNGGNAKSGPGGATNAVIPGLTPTKQEGLMAHIMPPANDTSKRAR